MSITSKTDDQPRVAFIILCWNNVDILAECFESIQAQTYKNHFTVMVDNGSADESVAFTKKNFPWVQVVETGRNTGFAMGNNIGIKHAIEHDSSVQHFVLLNTDARLDAAWLQQTVDFVRDKPKAATLQGTTLDYYNHRIVDSTHIYISRNGQATQGNWRHFYDGEMGPRKVFGANAAAIFITRAFIDAQPFGEELLDETMFIYLEDVDLATRATIMGWDNYLVPGARAYHMGSASSGKRPGFSLYMTFRNNTGLLVKNLPWKLIGRILPDLIRGDIATIRHLRRHGNGAGAKKVLKGRLIGLLLVPKFLLKRHKLKKHVTIDPDYLWQLMRRGF